jgi:cytochrome o ubiquinol oxidase subunit 2
MESKNKFKISFCIFLVLDVIVFAYLALHHETFAILEPKGVTAFKQRELIIDALLVMLAVVIPVFAAFIYIVWKYREGNIGQDRNQDLKSRGLITTVMWGVSVTVIAIISVMIWKSSHELDPYKQIQSVNAPITIQVVALNWKWLFIYPEQNIATINYIKIPKNTPINFKLTADAPMNTFWIPQLGGQMYAMAGMENKINLMATEVGEFNGSATEINGRGYAGMRFKTVSVEKNDFDFWVQEVKNSAGSLTMHNYEQLVEDSENNPPEFFSGIEPDLFNKIMMPFMMPVTTESSENKTMPNEVEGDNHGMDMQMEME